MIQIGGMRVDLYRYKNDSENKKNVLRIIYNEEDVSRNGLVEKTGLTLSTVTKFVTELINDGVVEESGTLESTGGRKSSILRVNPNYAYIIGIDIGTYSTRIGVVRINGEIIEKEAINEGFNFLESEINLEDISIRVENIISKYGNSRLLGIGIGISGMVNAEEGKVIFSPNVKGFDGVNVVEILEKKFSVPVFLDTSFRCMALAEQWFGVGKGIQNQIFISVGYGTIGTGIIIDSKLFKGSRGFSGELGHVQVDENGIRCTCGNFGCLELYATLYMIIQNIEEQLEKFKGYSPMKLFLENNKKNKEEIMKEALLNGDKIVYGELMEAGKLIGIAISNMVNLFNPELIVFGGGVVENFPIIVEKVERIIRERALITVQNNLSIKRSMLGWDSPIKGCSVLLISRFLE